MVPHLPRRSALIGAGVIALAASASGDDDDQPSAPVVFAQSPMYTDVLVETVAPDPYSLAWGDPRLLSLIGIGINVGGGAFGFTGRAMRELIEHEIGGAWSVRAAFGTHTPLGIDIGYLGTASQLQTLSGIDNGILFGTTIEGALRFNMQPHFMWNPYVFAGAGWQRYFVRGEHIDLAQLRMQNSDNLVEFPLGAGLSYRYVDGVVFDLRGTFRVTQREDLLRKPSGAHASLHTWEAHASVGYEF